MEKIKRKPFLYLGARYYFPSSITREIGERVEAKKGKKVHLTIYDGVWGSGYGGSDVWNSEVKKLKEIGRAETIISKVDKTLIDLKPIPSCLLIPKSLDQKTYESDDDYDIIRDLEGKISPRRDGFYRFFLDLKDGREVLETLYDRKDPLIDYKYAYDSKCAHWGDQRWSEITLEIKKDEKILHTSKIDIFGPKTKDFTRRFIVYGVYSLEKLIT